MTRGTFANIRIRNLLAPGTEGGVTRHLPDGERDADLRRGDEVQGARACRWWCWPARNTAPARSRDWAAKGAFLLGRAGGARRQLRANPPQQPGRHGRPAAGVRPGHHLAIARPHRRRSVRHPGARTNRSARGRRSPSSPRTPRARRRNSRCWCESTRRSSWTTIETAAFCRR